MNSIYLNNPEHILSRFCLCGISYQKTDAATRGLFHISDVEKTAILLTAKEVGIRSLFILTTCNRTELYAYAADIQIITNLFINCKQIEPSLFNEKSYIKSGKVALQHLFEVASGLDSQILGDHEILAQLKQAVAFSQAVQMVGPIMDRTINFAFQASKKIKTNTAISSGTTSVSFATIEWLKKNTDVTGKKIALVGLGKFGSLVGKNLQHYFKQSTIVVCNRTDEKAAIFAIENKVQMQAYSGLPQLVNDADIVIVSTQAPTPTVMPQFISTIKPRIFIDLSIPANVHFCIKEMPLQLVVNVDDISSMLNEVFAKRKNELPAALQIVNDMQADFFSWLGSHSHAPMVREVKDKLFALSNSTKMCEMADTLEYDFITPQDEQTIQKTISRLAVNLRNNQPKGCQFIDAYNHFFSQQTSE